MTDSQTAQLIAAVVALAVAAVALVLKQYARNGKKRSNGESRREPSSGELTPSEWEQKIRDIVSGEAKGALTTVLFQLEEIRRDTSKIRELDHAIVNGLGPIEGIVKVLVNQMERLEARLPRR